MGPAAPAPLPLGRLAGVGLVVFFANAALLVLQLVAGKLLAPFIGSSLETWTSVIGVFLAGIALGNGFGGKIADRYPTPRTLAVLLALGAVAALWMLLFPKVLAGSGLHKSIPLGPRIPVLALALCLPAGLVLSLLTPVAIKLGLPDVSKTGRVAGLIFSLSTLGCLLGNYVTGFYLIPTFAINTLVTISAAALFGLAVVTLVLLRQTPTVPAVVADAPAAPADPVANPDGFADIRKAFLIVFVGSFCGMTLELTASRLLAQMLGVSLYTWTGIIGVMLAGTALGNLTGGLVADWANRPTNGAKPRVVLAATLIAAGGGAVMILMMLAVVTRAEVLAQAGLISQVLGWTFALFFLPMFVLGMVSPQVIRLCITDVATAGSVAGRVYAWSTAGAIVGTFATGYALLSTLGIFPTILSVAMGLTLASLLVMKVWETSVLLYLFASVLGGVTGGFILKTVYDREPNVVAKLETNYYTIRVVSSGRFLDMRLDLLLHSTVDPENPAYLYYTHEHVQMEFLRTARGETAEPKVLVIGGGGYTFPRCAKTLLPETQMDVVEIDPGVTKMAYEAMGLRPELGIRHFHMDGRQYVSERVPASTYDVVMQDAVNDLSVPGHLLTKEYNDAVKAALKPNGVYLLTIIDGVEQGYLWKAAMRTLRQTFPAENVHLISAGSFGKDGGWARSRAVYVIYASEKPLDLAAMQAAVRGQFEGGTGAIASGAVAAVSPPPFYSFPVPQDWLDPYLVKDPGVILTDQFAPVDNLMAEAFRNRNKVEKPKGEE